MSFLSRIFGADKPARESANLARERLVADRRRQELSTLGKSIALAISESLPLGQELTNSVFDVTGGEKPGEVRITFRGSLESKVF